MTESFNSFKSELKDTIKLQNISKATITAQLILHDYESMNKDEVIRVCRTIINGIYLFTDKDELLNIYKNLSAYLGTAWEDRA